MAGVVLFLDHPIYLTVLISCEIWDNYRKSHAHSQLMLQCLWTSGDITSRVELHNDESWRNYLVSVRSVAYIYPADHTETRCKQWGKSSINLRISVNGEIYIIPYILAYKATSHDGPLNLTPKSGVWCSWLVYTFVRAYKTTPLF